MPEEKHLLLSDSVPDANNMVLLLKEFTDCYKSFQGDDIEMREAMCFRIQWKGMVRPIRDGDLFAGRMVPNAIGYAGQAFEASTGYYCHQKSVEEILNNPCVTDQNKKELEQLVRFWEINNTVHKAKTAFTEKMKTVLPSDYYFSEPGIAFTLWRMSGIQIDYYKLIKSGINGLRDEVKSLLSSSNNGSKEAKLYKAMLVALETFTDICLYYSDMAESQALINPDKMRSGELHKMAQILKNISVAAPCNFREGLQLMYLYNIVDQLRNYGRMDDYLGDLYEADLTEGIMDDEEAVRLLSGIWLLMRDRGFRYDTRLIIGGRGRINEKNADKVALLIMETSNRVREIVPQVALRFYEGQNHDLYNKGLDVLASGYTYPMLYNDDVNIPAVQHAFGIPYEEAMHSIQFGCGEYVINHRSVGTPSGVINLLQALIVTINYGIDPVTGKHMGMPPEYYLKYNDFKTFEDLFSAYKEQIEYHIEQLALHEELEYIYAGQDNPYLYSSMLMDDCLSKGKAIFSGGVRYLGGTLETYGNTNVADSLTAIKELVYETKGLTINKLCEILKADFNGYGKERKMMLDCPKYGNDNEIADNMFLEVHNHVCSITGKQKENTSLHSYLVVIINNDANTVMGEQTPASPDGRQAFTYMNPGNNPVGGADKSGLTAFLNSLVKPSPDIHGGSVQNMKFSKELFINHRGILEALLDTYFDNGGSQAMLTVTSRRDLEDAMLHPENYQNLIVRVGGFSERFINLPPETQREVLSRTLY